MIWWIISWLVVGFITAAVVVVKDMRGKSFDEDYFANGDWVLFLIAIILGPCSAIAILSVVASKKKYGTRFVYWLCNLGVKREEVEDV